MNNLQKILNSGKRELIFSPFFPNSYQLHPGLVVLLEPVLGHELGAKQRAFREGHDAHHEQLAVAHFEAVGEER